MARSYQNYSPDFRSAQILAGIGLAAIACLGSCLVPPTATAQNTPAASQNNPQQTQNYQVIYVNPNTGSDQNGNGSQDSPLKTITQALAVAQQNTVIRLATGTYNSASGEQFPLRLQPGVTLQGNPDNRGQNVVIEGGGRFISSTYGQQNVAIVAADWSGLAGVTVTNSNPRGYGIWVESASPVIVNNTLAGNTHDGVAVLGKSDAIIQNNNVLQNGANGITVYGRATPRIQGNRIDRTGFGLNVAEQAAPIVVDNIITRNRDGVLVQGDAQPILRQNRIANNKQDGVVAIGNALPNLGMKGQPGNNEIRNNGRYNIHNNATSRIIPAFGNQVSRAKLQGRVDIEGNLMPNPTNAPSNSREAIAQLPPSLDPQPTNRASNSNTSSSSNPRFSQQNRNLPTATNPNTRLTSPNFNRSSNANAPESDIDVPTSTNPIEIQVPQPQASTNSRSANQQPSNRDRNPRPRRRSPLPSLDTTDNGNTSNNILPVPDANIPSSDGSSLTTNVPNRQPSSNNPPPPTTSAAARLGLKYRVIVDAQSERERERVRSLVPEAFRIGIDGDTWLQAGAFQERYRALQLLYKLRRQGLRAVIQSLEGS
jgi:parallel beta-helix repeat protein